MASRFNPEKATAAATYLLKLRGGKMSYLKLIKLLYLADREALSRWGFSVTTDRYVSMDHGPVVSNIYNLITVEEPTETYWSKFVSAPLGNHEVELRTQHIPEDSLSRAEQALLKEVFDTYGSWSRWKIRDYTHELPEWKDPKGSSVPISVQEILRATGSTQEEIDDVIRERNACDAIENVIGRA